jgi:excisionase family DNA binding protein
MYYILEVRGKTMKGFAEGEGGRGDPQTEVNRPARPPLKGRPHKLRLTTREFAHLARRKRETIEEMCRRGELKAKKKGGFWLIPEEELIRFWALTGHGKGKWPKVCKA